jgi:hypothetical protein
VATRSGKLVDRKDDKDVAAVLAKDESLIFPSTWFFSLATGFSLSASAR